MSWQRQPVAEALVTRFTSATEGVMVHPLPPETLNGPCIVVMRPQLVTYSVVGFTIDEATLPIAIVSGIEQENVIDSIKNACRQALLADQTLGGVVAAASAIEERNWRNVTGAGGIQLLYCELILSVRM